MLLVTAFIGHLICLKFGQQTSIAKCKRSHDTTSPSPPLISFICQFFSYPDTIDLQLKYLFFSFQYALPYLRKTKGCIVNTGSIGSSAAALGMSSYCASKVGIVYDTRFCHVLLTSRYISPSRWAELTFKLPTMLEAALLCLDILLRRNAEAMFQVLALMSKTQLKFKYPSIYFFWTHMLHCSKVYSCKSTYNENYWCVVVVSMSPLIGNIVSSL
jgi:hypothetical protein